MNEKAPTIYDVAERAGVSIATVSRVLTGGSASSSSRTKVEEAISALGYKPSAPIRQDTRVIAMVLSPQTSPYYASMCEGATAEALRAGYLPVLYSYPDTTPIERITDDLLANKPAGALLAGFAVEQSLRQDVTRSCLLRIQQAMPLVAIGPPIEGIECARLTSDPSQCVRKSMAHLTMLGHRRIAFIGGDRSARFSNIREAAYHEEAERLGCVVRPDYVALTGVNAPAGELAINILLGSIPQKEHPTAIFAINDLVALGAIAQLHRHNIRIPEDIAIVGCDNTFFAPSLTPSLTTVDLHPRAHGRSAVAELIAAIQGSHTISFNNNVECSLVIRESCGAHLGVRQFE
ncbi:MAG: LacI family DNA-binding transcriptional regulator [Clostridia bacterium]|nr:LacI family DNA-binding transcriptional regulator [Clostridia bacterium]